MKNRWAALGVGLGLGLAAWLGAGAGSLAVTSDGDGMAGAAAPKVTIEKAPAGAKMVDAKIGADGVIHLLFQMNDMPFYARVTEGGQKLGPTMPVIAERPTAGLKYLGWELAVDGKGKVFAAMGNNAWELKLPEDKWGLYLAALEPGAGKFGPMTALNSLPSEGFSIVAGKDGAVTAAYLRKGLWWKQSTDAGKTFSENAMVNKDYLPCPCCTTSMAYAKDGTLGILYRESTNNKRDMFVVLVKDGKEKRVALSRTLWEINACPMTYYSIAPAGDGFVAAWPTKGEVYFARLGTDGKVWGPGEVKVGGKSFMRSSVFALAGKNDTTLVAWKSDEKLHWRMYDGRGRPTGEVSEAAGAGPQAGGVVDKDGNFLLFP